MGLRLVEPCTAGYRMTHFSKSRSAVIVQNVSCEVHQVRSKGSRLVEPCTVEYRMTHFSKSRSAVIIQYKM